MELLHQEKMYPPRIELTVQLKQRSNHVLSVHVSGCDAIFCDDEFQLQFSLPLGLSIMHVCNTHNILKGIIVGISQRQLRLCNYVSYYF